MLDIDCIAKMYDNRQVINQASLSIGSEIKVLIGINGCGKSTLLKIIAGIIQADSGNIRLEGRDITALTPEKRQVGYVPQHPALFRHKSVLDNMRYGMRNGRGSDAFLNKMVSMLNLEELLHKKPNELSGGYKSRVSLVRALAADPRIMLLDEPLSQIDVVVKEKLLPEFRSLLKLLKIPVLYVTHDPGEAEKIGDRFAVMVDGVIKDIDSASEAFGLIKNHSLSLVE